MMNQLRQAFGLAWRWLQFFARAVADFQARLLLSIFYWVALAPFAIIVKRWGDPLALKIKGKGWTVRTEPAPDHRRRAREQF